MVSKASGEDRRRDIRVKLSKPLVIKIHLEKGKRFFGWKIKKKANVKDMSVGGMCVEFPVFSEAQAKLIARNKDRFILEFKVPEYKKPIKVKSKLVRVVKGTKPDEPPFIAGFYFENIKEKDREKLLDKLINFIFENFGTID